MKRLFTVIAAILAAIMFSSCDEINISDSEEYADYVLTSIEATFEGMPSETKTTTDGSKVEWLAGDAISVFFGASESSKFTTETSGKIVQFKGSIDVVTGGEGLNSGTSLWGVYPYDSKTTCDGTSVTYTLPAIQEAKADSFADDLFPTLARSQNFAMSFYNICGGWCFMVSNSDIVKVTLKGNRGEKIAGKARITMDGRPVVSEILDGTTELTMYAPDGGCFETGKYYYFVLYPTEFSEGLTITYHKADSQASYSVNKSVTTTRSVFNYLTNRDKELVFENLDNKSDYVDEYGVNHGKGVDIDGIVWAPVNCGYHETDYPYGKLYQWGRIYGQGYEGNVYDSDGLVGKYSDATVPVCVHHSSGISVSEGQSKIYVNWFFVSNYQYDYDWAYPPHMNLWYRQYGNSIKSEYDPCPKGWRVPTKGELSSLVLNYSSGDFNGQGGNWYSGSVEYSDDVSRVFLPAAGYRKYDGEASLRGTYGRYWTSSPVTVYIGYYSKYFSFALNTAGDAFQDGRRGEGYSVRCVQE